MIMENTRHLDMLFCKFVHKWMKIAKYVMAFIGGAMEGINLLLLYTHIYTPAKHEVWYKLYKANYYNN